MCPRRGGRRARPSRRPCGVGNAGLTAGTISRTRAWLPGLTMWWVTEKPSALGLAGGKLPYRLGVAAQAAARDGQSVEVPMYARTADAEKSTGSHRRRGRRAGIGRIRMKRINCRPDSTHGWEGYRPGGAWLSTSTTFWPVRASRPPSCCPTFTGWLPVEALVDRDAPRRCEP